MMFTRIAISTIALILATGIIFYFQYFIILISRPISSGISGVGVAVNIYLLLYSLPIAATLEAVLLAGLTYRGLIPRNLGIVAICVFFAIAAIVIFSPIFVPVFGMSFLIISLAFPVQLCHA